MDEVEYHASPPQWARDYIEEVGDETVEPSVWSAAKPGVDMPAFLHTPLMRFAALWAIFSCLVTCAIMAVIQ